MTELLVMRHAKSDWGSGAAADRDRPLAPRGVKAATCMGALLTRIGAVPGLVLSSPAVRARTTAELAAAAGGWPADVEIAPGFYGGGWADVVRGVVAARPTADRVLVVGHEPTWSDLVSALCGGGRVAMPTAAVSCLAVEGGWTSLGADCAELRWHVTPRMLENLL